MGIKMIAVHYYQFPLRIHSIMIITITTTLIIIATVAAEHPSTEEIIALPGCNSTCGHIKIPFPFGMKDPKCYANSWYEIECRSRNSTSTHRPYLKSLNVQVTFINTTLNTMGIMNPIHRWNCEHVSDATNTNNINLRGSPFVYSQDYAKFMAVGCNSLALLRSHGSTVGGCVSLCDDNDYYDQLLQSDNIGCHGRFCCETSLPMSLSEFNVTLQSLGQQRRRGCGGGGDSAAAIVSDDFRRKYHRVRYNDYDTPRLINDLRMMDYVEAVLEWTVESDMPFINLTQEISPDLNFCYYTNVTHSPNRTNEARCQCSFGFFGNAYIPRGCIAIPGFNDKNNRKKKWAIIGVSSSVGSITFLLGLWWLYKVVKQRMIKKRKEKFFKRNGGLLLQQRMSSGEVNIDKAILFSLNNLEKATDNFNMNRVLGKGGQGTVYKGMLEDGKIIAVKKFKVEGKVEEFINEFVILSQINHRNVVKLLGCCLETEIPLLVYEFIPNGNLFEYLHDQNKDLAMTWDMRLRIVAEIAGSLFYLHSVASQPIYHRDIKSTNILLDEKYRAKVADFGTSRIVSNIEATHLTTVVRGTFGYLDPEYFHSSQFTEKSDVYSFGVVLVELLTSKKPIFTVRSRETQSLASYFVQCMEENSLFNIIDKKVTNEAKREHIIAVANLANRCLELNGRKRPTMKEVTLELERIRGKDNKSNVLQNYQETKGIIEEVDGIEVGQYWEGCATSTSIISM